MRTESDLRHSERTEVLGFMASSLAHDLSNVFMTISACAKVLVNQTDTESMRGPIELIERATTHGSKVVHRLLRFGRADAPELNVIDINELLRSMEPMFRVLGGEQVTLEMDLASEPCGVLADPVEIELALLNLIRNSSDAMPSGGRITVSTRILDLTADNVAEYSGAKPEKFVKLVVTDTGVGMDDETRSNVFEPFFTTKQEHGTGLGLSTVKAVVKRYRGYISCSSRVNDGTSITIRFPRVA